MIASTSGSELARRVEPHRRQPQALAEDLGGGAVAAGGGAADVRPVGAHAGEAEERALVEGRRHHVHVGQVAAAEVGIVVDEDVARRERARGADHRLHGERHRAEMDRQVRALRHHLAGDVEEAAGVVARHLEERRVGGLGEHHLHLLGGAVERVLHHLEGGGIELAVDTARRLSHDGSSRGSSKPPGVRPARASRAGRRRSCPSPRRSSGPVRSPPGLERVARQHVARERARSP